MSTIERINQIPRWAPDDRVVAVMAQENDGDYVELRDVLATIEEPWQDERPTETGDYYVSIAPEKRGPWPDLPAVIACEIALWAVDMDGLGTGLRVRCLSGGMWLPFIDNPFFDGAKWQRRTTPSDPFVKEKVQP